MLTGCGGGGDGQSIGSASSGGKAQAKLTIYWGGSPSISTRGRFIPLNANLIIVTVRDHQRNEIISKRAVRGTVATETLTFNNLPSGEAIFEALAFETANPGTDTPNRTSALSGSGEKVVRLYSGSDNAVALTMTSLIDSIHVFQGAVDSSEFVVKAGASIALSAVRYQGGVPLPGGVIVWESSDSSVATVDASGVVRGLKIGEILLKVRELGNSDTGMTGTVRVTVSFFSTNIAQYTAIEIPRLPGYDQSDVLVVQDMNDSGQVVGYCWGVWKPYKGFLWDPSSGIRELSIDGKILWPSAINNKGQICGNYAFDDAHRHPVILNPDGRYIDLYEKSKIGYNSGASNINEDGIVVGIIYLGNFDGNYAIIWSRDGSSFEYCNPIGSPTFVYGNEEARVINNNNEVVGLTNSAKGDIGQGFLFRSGVYTALDKGKYLFTDASSINNASSVVGGVHSGDSNIRKAAIWEPGKSVRVLAGLQDINGDPGSQATDINDYGDIVGWNGLEALFWKSSGDVISLNKYIKLPEVWGFTFANRVNNKGQIIINVNAPSVPSVSGGLSFLLVPR